MPVNIGGKTCAVLHEIGNYGAGAFQTGVDGIRGGAVDDGLYATHSGSSCCGVSKDSDCGGGAVCSFGRREITAFCLAKGRKEAKCRQGQ